MLLPWSPFSFFSVARVGLQGVPFYYICFKISQCLQCVMRMSLKMKYLFHNLIFISLEDRNTWVIIIYLIVFHAKNIKKIKKNRHFFFPPPPFLHTSSAFYISMASSATIINKRQRVSFPSQLITYRIDNRCLLHIWLKKTKFISKATYIINSTYTASYTVGVRPVMWVFDRPFGPSGRRR